MAGWGKLIAGAVIGVAGTVYATNEEVRKQLPKTVRDLPDSVRRRFDSAVSAAREASRKRRQEILRDLEAHGGDHGESYAAAEVDPGVAPEPEPVYEPTRGPLHEPLREDDTRPISRSGKE